MNSPYAKFTQTHNWAERPLICTLEGIPSEVVLAGFRVGDSNREVDVVNLSFWPGLRT